MFISPPPPKNMGHPPPSGEGERRKKKRKKEKKEEREYNTLGNSAFFSVWLNWVLRYDSFHGLGGYLDKSAGLSLLCERRLW